MKKKQFQFIKNVLLITILLLKTFILFIVNYLKLLLTRAFTNHVFFFGSKCLFSIFVFYNLIFYFFIVIIVAAVA